MSCWKAVDRLEIADHQKLVHGQLSKHRKRRKKERQKKKKGYQFMKKDNCLYVFLDKLFIKSER